MLAVVLAKPQTQKKFNVANPQNPTPVSNNNNHLGYAGIPVSPYASIAAGYGAAPGFQQVGGYILVVHLFLLIIFLKSISYDKLGHLTIQQPMIYGRGPMLEGMQMVPMVLSDGRIGYVL